MVGLLASVGISSRRSKLAKLLKVGKRVGTIGHSQPLELPQEVVDYIVDFLHDDIPALLGCSVLSHQWNDAARFHLFSSLELSGRQKLQGFEGFIHSPNSIAVHVQKLRINGQYPNLRPIVSPWALAAILTSLPHLTDLSLFHVHHTDHKNSPRLSPPKDRFALQSLELAYGGAATHHAPEHFLDVLGIFSEIDTLTLQYLRFEPKPSEPDGENQFDTALAQSIPKNLRVKKLVVDDVASGTEFWLETLRRTATATTLTTIHILTSFPWDPAPLGYLLSAVGPNLYSLKLDVSGILAHMADPVANIADRLSLSSCTELKHLTIRATPAVIRNAVYLTALCVLIEAVAGHNTLETFTFSCNHSGHRDDIFRALRASRSLRTVTFVDNLMEKKLDEQVVRFMESQLREMCTDLPEDVVLRLRATEPEEE